MRSRMTLGCSPHGSAAWDRRQAWCAERWAQGSLHTGVGLAGCRKGAPLLHGATTLYADDEGVDAGPRPPSCANQQGTSAPEGLVPGHASLRGSLNACGPGRALRAKPGPCPWRIRPSLLQVTRARSTREETSPARYSVLFR